jgi:hypothetical protein
MLEEGLKIKYRYAMSLNHIPTLIDGYYSC